MCSTPAGDQIKADWPGLYEVPKKCQFGEGKGAQPLPRHEEKLKIQDLENANAMTNYL